MEIETIENIFNFLEDKEGKKITKSVLYSIKKLKLIKELENHPDGTQYRHEGDLFLNLAKIKKLPNDLYITGKLYLESCTQLKVLPSKLYVGNNLDLSNCRNITELPDDLYVGGYLALDNTNIANFPNNLYVESNIYLYNTPLTKKYTTYNQMHKIIKSTGGKINGTIQM